jgi:hypothetical protein
MYGSPKYKRVRVEGILLYIVHIIPNGALGYWTTKFVKKVRPLKNASRYSGIQVQGRRKF